MVLGALQMFATKGKHVGYGVKLCPTGAVVVDCSGQRCR